MRRPFYHLLCWGLLVSLAAAQQSGISSAARKVAAGPNLMDREQTFRLLQALDDRGGLNAEEREFLNDLRSHRRFQPAGVKVLENLDKLQRLPALWQEGDWAALGDLHRYFSTSQRPDIMATLGRTFLDQRLAELGGISDWQFDRWSEDIEGLESLNQSLWASNLLLQTAQHSQAREKSDWVQKSQALRDRLEIQQRWASTHGATCSAQVRLLRFPGGASEKDQMACLRLLSLLSQRKDYGGVERALELFEKQRTKLSDGRSAAVRGYALVLDPGFLQGWRAAMPHSPRPHLALARLHLRDGWARWQSNRPGFTSADSDFQIALRECEAARGLKADRVTLACLELSLARVQGVSPIHRREIWRQASRLDPLCLEAHLELGRGLLPRWGGSKASLDELCQEGARATSQQWGPNGFYALLCWGLCRLQDAEKEIMVDQKRAMAGFDDLVKRSPQSQNLPRYRKYLDDLLAGKKGNGLPPYELFLEE